MPSFPSEDAYDAAIHSGLIAEAEGEILLFMRRMGAIPGTDIVFNPGLMDFVVYEGEETGYWRIIQRLVRSGRIELVGYMFYRKRPMSDERPITRAVLRSGCCVTSVHAYQLTGRLRRLPRLLLGPDAIYKRFCREMDDEHRSELDETVVSRYRREYDAAKRRAVAPRRLFWGAGITAEQRAALLDGRKPDWRRRHGL